jgi:hypothetical protein
MNDTRFAALKARLREPLGWFPMPFFISFALVLVLTGHVLSGTNPRLGNPADVITLPAEARPDSAIWLSVSVRGDQVYVTTGDRKVFHWARNVARLDELDDFVSYLKERVKGEIAAAALLNRIEVTQSSAVIAADQRLTYAHIRPLLHAFAAAGISQYAFETQNPREASLGVPARNSTEPGEPGESHAE